MRHLIAIALLTFLASTVEARCGKGRGLNRVGKIFPRLFHRR